MTNFGPKETISLLSKFFVKKKQFFKGAIFGSFSRILFFNFFQKNFSLKRFCIKKMNFFFEE